MDEKVNYDQLNDTNHHSNRTFLGISKKKIILFVLVSILILVIVLSIGLTASKNSESKFDMMTSSKSKPSFKPSEATQSGLLNIEKRQRNRLQQKIIDNGIVHDHPNGMIKSAKRVSFFLPIFYNLFISIFFVAYDEI